MIPAMARLIGAKGQLFSVRDHYGQRLQETLALFPFYAPPERSTPFRVDENDCLRQGLPQHCTSAFVDLNEEKVQFSQVSQHPKRAQFVFGHALRNNCQSP